MPGFHPAARRHKVRRCEGDRVRAFLTWLAVAAIAMGAAPPKPEPEFGPPDAAFAGGPIRLSKASAGFLRQHFQGDKVPIVPQPFRTRLDTALLAHDPARLEAAKKELIAVRGPMAALMWEQTRFLATGGAGIAELHARDLAATGSSAVAETSAMLWLYAVAATLTDGYQCNDRAAKDAHLVLLQGPAFEPVTRIVKTLAEDRLAAMRDLAIRLESVLSAGRADDTMCRVGTTKPELKPDQAWRTDATRTRAMLPKHLAALCAVLRAKPAVASAARPGARAPAVVPAAPAAAPWVPPGSGPKRPEPPAEPPAWSESPPIDPPPPPQAAAEPSPEPMPPETPAAAPAGDTPSEPARP